MGERFGLCEERDKREASLPSLKSLQGVGRSTSDCPLPPGWREWALGWVLLVFGLLEGRAGRRDCLCRVSRVLSALTADCHLPDGECGVQGLGGVDFAEVYGLLEWTRGRQDCHL